ncbi:hypothetical protein FK498_05625 [Elioraea sp. Yellowstone]|nr:hypothetical protein FK498_05625 [Elioraea sp. Yellowstone]
MPARKAGAPKARARTGSPRMPGNRAGVQVGIDSANRRRGTARADDDLKGTGGGDRASDPSAHP